MKRLALLLLVSIICSAYPAWAQTHSIGLGAAFEPDGTPRSSGVFQYIIGSGDTRPYTEITMRPIAVSGVTFSASAGIIRRLARGLYRIPGSDVDREVFLESFARGGVATRDGGTSGLFSGGGALVFPTHYGVDFVFTGEAVAAPLIDGWQARVGAGLRFNFFE